MALIIPKSARCLVASTTPVGHQDWRGRRVTVMGLGRHGGGLGAVCYLASQGARVTVSDQAEPEELADSLAALNGLTLEAVNVGGHDLADFCTAEFVVVNPAVRPSQPLLRRARETGAVLTSEIELFLAACPAHVVGVTGSNGKSTTCAMLAEILAAAGHRTWLGGNFGGSLLRELNYMRADDWVVLELSSFQLAHLSDACRRPEIAVITNCTPNHLDWHASWDDYRNAKRRIVDANSICILGDCEGNPQQWVGNARVQRGWQSDDVPKLEVIGRHNRRNAALAAAAAETAGVDGATICRSLSRFSGLPHRLEFVAEIQGRRFYNDSKSTTPAATQAALAAIDEPVWLLAGGLAKGADLSVLGPSIATGVRGAAFFGAARSALARCASDYGVPARDTEHLADALRWCWQRSRPGDTILLSPACASQDQFRDFADRGRQYCQLIRQLSVTIQPSDGLHTASDLVA